MRRRSQRFKRRKPGYRFRPILVEQLESRRPLAADFFETESQSAAIDLVAIDLAVPQVADPGDVVILQSSIKNAGNQSASSKLAHAVYLSEDMEFDEQQDLRLALDQPGQIRAGETRTRDIQATLPSWAAGQYYFILVADVYFEQNESDETNNRFVTPILIRGPDLVVIPESFPAVVKIESDFDLKWQVSNIGEVATIGSFETAVYASEDDQLDAGDIRIATEFEFEPLNAPGSTTLSSTTFLPRQAAQANYWLLVVDHPDHVCELNEANNVFAIRFSTLAADLNITSAGAPRSAAAGDAIDVEWTVENQGVLPSEEWWFDGVYISNRESWNGSERLLKQFANPAGSNIEVGGSYSQKQSITLPNDLGSGDYFLTVVANSRKADMFNWLPERNHTNNFRFLPFKIEAPDLVPKELIAPSTIVVGDRLDVAWTIANEGSVPARSSWRDYLWFSTDSVLTSADRQILAPQLHQGLNAGESYTTSLPITIPQLPPGPGYLFLATDQNVVTGFRSQGESNDDNNLLSVPVEVLAPDLTVTRAEGPDAVAVGQPIEVEWTIKNLGAVPAFGNSRDILHFSKDQVWDESDTYVARFTEKEVLVAGGEAKRSMAFEVPQHLTAGDWFILVTADGRENQFASTFQSETNEGNNTFAIPVSVLATDLAITEIRLPAEVPNDFEVDLSWTLENQGDVPAFGPWSNTIFLSKSDSLDGSHWAISTVVTNAVIQPGMTLDVSFPLLIRGVPVGSYYLFVETNRDYLPLTETDSSNNLRGIPIQILAPDLVLTSVDIPSILPVDEPIVISWTVENRGNGAARWGWRDDVELSYGTSLLRQTIVSISPARTRDLAPGESYTLTAEVALNVSVADISLRVVADANLIRSDFQFDNNSVIHVIPGNQEGQLRIEDYEVPQVIVAGERFSVQWTVGNAGPGYVMQNWSELVAISTDDRWDQLDRWVAHGSHVLNSIIPAGSTANSTLNASTSSDLQGRQFLLIRVASGPDIHNDENSDLVAVPVFVVPPHARWRNPQTVADVNGDGYVVPQDVLIVFNELNGRQLSDKSSAKITASRNASSYFFDVNGDGFITTGDALNVINRIHGFIETEGEASDPILIPAQSNLEVPSGPASVVAKPKAQQLQPKNFKGAQDRGPAPPIAEPVAKITANSADSLFTEWESEMWDELLHREEG